MQTTESLIHHNLQDMRMSGNEESWRICHYLVKDTTVIFSRISTNMLHQDIYFLAHKSLYLRELASNIRTVNITIDSTKRCNSP